MNKNEVVKYKKLKKKCILEGVHKKSVLVFETSNQMIVPKLFAVCFYVLLLLLL